MIWLEALAAITGLISVYFVTRQNIWCWPTGLVSVFLAAIVFYESFLYSDMLLHIYYIGMNIYGWIHWSKKAEDAPILPVTTMTWRRNLFWIIVTAVGTVGWGYTMQAQTNAAFPYGDAFTTVASLAGMWFMAQKRLENWVYWFVVDVVAITIYALKGLYLFSGQYAIFLILCVLGYRNWKKAMA